MRSLPAWRIVDCWWPNAAGVGDHYPFFVDRGITIVGGAPDEDYVRWRRAAGPFQTRLQAELWIQGGATRIVGHYDAQGRPVEYDDRNPALDRLLRGTAGGTP